MILPSLVSSAQSSILGVPVPNEEKETGISVADSDLAVMRSAIKASAETSKNPEAFEVKHLGSSLMILKPPQKLLGKKGRMPKFLVSVHRGDQKLSHKLERLFDNVFTLRLEQEDAFGKIKIAINIHKPQHQETHEIDLGRSWLRMNDWKQSVRSSSRKFMRDFERLETEVSDFSKWCMSFLPNQEVLDRVSEKVDLVQRKAIKSLQTTAISVQKRSKQLRAASAERSKEMSKRLTSDFRKALGSLTIQSRSTAELSRQVVADIWQSASDGVARFSALASSSQKLPRIAADNLSTAQKRAQYIMKKASGKSSNAIGAADSKLRCHGRTKFRMKKAKAGCR